MKITGLKKAVGSYKELNKGGYYSPRYGYLMFDKGTGQIWTDEFYDLGHNSWVNYTDSNVINLGQLMAQDGMTVSMANVKEYISKHFS